MITFLAHPALSSPPPAPARFGSPVTVARPRHSAAGGTLFQEPSGVSWIVLEHLPDVQKSCRLSGNCNAVVAGDSTIMRPRLVNAARLKPRLLVSTARFRLIRRLNGQVLPGSSLFHAGGSAGAQ